MSNHQPSARREIWHSLWDALFLNAHFYETAHNAPNNRRIAFTIVLLSELSYMLGNAVILVINRVSPLLFFIALFINGIGVILGYYFWTFTIWKLGQWLESSHPTYRELLSPIGFAYTPQVLNFLTLIPLLGRPIALILAVWSLLAVIVAVRQGLDISTRRSAFICLVGFPIVQIAIAVVQTLIQQFVGVTV